MYGYDNRIGRPLYFLLLIVIFGMTFFLFFHYLRKLQPVTEIYGTAYTMTERNTDGVSLCQLWASPAALHPSEELLIYLTVARDKTNRLETGVSFVVKKHEFKDGIEQWNIIPLSYAQFAPDNPKLKGLRNLPDVNNQIRRLNTDKSGLARDLQAAFIAGNFDADFRSQEGGGATRLHVQGSPSRQVLTQFNDCVQRLGGVYLE